VPVKTLSEAKSRLQSVLSDAERLEISLQMLHRVLSALQDAKLVDKWLVISRDPRVLDIAQDKHGLPLLEDGLGLNSSLEQASRWADAQGAAAILVVPSDLPLITAREIDMLIRQAGSEPCAVIAPSRHGEGTNALLLRPPGALPFCFGPGSAARHAEEARRRGLSVRFHVSESFGLDIDTEEDLRELTNLRLIAGAGPFP
jgi:2-phospho-L-lactate guanylyltransferase